MKVNNYIARMSEDDLIAFYSYLMLEQKRREDNDDMSYLSVRHLRMIVSQVSKNVRNFDVFSAYCEAKQNKEVEEVQSYSELTLTDGTDEIMFHLGSLGTIKAIYTYSDNSLPYTNHWQSNRNFAFVHCPENEIAERAKDLLSNPLYTFGYLNESDAQRVSKALELYDIAVDAGLYGLEL